MLTSPLVTAREVAPEESNVDTEVSPDTSKTSSQCNCFINIKTAFYCSNSISSCNVNITIIYCKRSCS